MSSGRVSSVGMASGTRDPNCRHSPSYRCRPRPIPDAGPQSDALRRFPPSASYVAGSRPAALCRCGQMSISRRPRSHGPLKCLDSEPCMDRPFFVSRYGRVSINSAARCRKIQRHSLPSDAAVSELGVGCCNSERKGFIIDIGALQQLREEPGARSVGQLTTHRLPC